jgi:hypothetical protein
MAKSSAFRPDQSTGTGDCEDAFTVFSLRSLPPTNSGC